MATATDLIGRLAPAEICLAERMEPGFREVREARGAGFKELREVQASTAYKLNGLIDTVDKMVRTNGYGN